MKTATIRLAADRLMFNHTPRGWELLHGLKPGSTGAWPRGRGEMAAMAS
jgi:hypothetical protein